MKMLSLLLTVLLSVNVFAKDAEHFEGFVKIASGKELFVKWQYAKPGQPTVVLINGLTYTVDAWDGLTKALTEKGVGVFRYDPIGMGQTLLKYAPITDFIRIENQVEDFHSLLEVMKVPKPYNFVGLSYGGGLSLKYISKYTGDVKRMILMSPYTEPIRVEDQWIQMEVAATRAAQPWNPYSDDEIYDYFLKQYTYQNTPSAEPVVLSNPYILEAIFRLSQGIRHFNADTVLHQIPDQSFHLMVAEKDQYISQDVFSAYWNKVPSTAKVSELLLKDTEHKIPTAVPRFAAAWIEEILKDNPVISNGRQFEGNPMTGQVTYDGGQLKLPKEFP